MWPCFAIKFIDFQDYSSATKPAVIITVSLISSFFPVQDETCSLTEKILVSETISLQIPQMMASSMPLFVPPLSFFSEDTWTGTYAYMDWFSFLCYHILTAVLGNISITTSDSKTERSPSTMFFFLAMLSSVDLGLSTSTISQDVWHLLVHEENLL